MGYGQYTALPLNINQGTNLHKQTLKTTKEFFDFYNCIGKGGTSRVRKVKLKRNRQYYALKEMSKYQLSIKNAISLAFNERDILLPLNNGFIGNLYCSFQDKENLYLLFDLLSGCDLRYHLSNDKYFNEEQIKFFAACIILGIEYIHSNKIAHRDIKPENIICDDRGYARLIDFGISKKLSKLANEAEVEINGTYGYIAPELILSRSLSFEADYFALGVVLYELCLGERPFIAKSKYDMVQEYKTKQINMTLNELPSNFSRNENLCDFINQLLIIDPIQRLGHNGVQELKTHKLFNKFNWTELEHKDMISPFIPKQIELNLNKQCGSDILIKDKDKDNSDEKKAQQLKQDKENDETFQKLFEDFSNFEYIQKSKSIKFNSGNIGLFKRTSFVHLRRESRTFGQQANSTSKNFLLLRQTPMKLKMGNNNFNEKGYKETPNSCVKLSKLKRVYKQIEDPESEFPNINKMKCVSPDERKFSLPKDKITALSIISKNLFHSRMLRKNNSLSYLK